MLGEARDERHTPEPLAWDLPRDLQLPTWYEVMRWWRNR